MSKARNEPATGRGPRTNVHNQRHGDEQREKGGRSNAAENFIEEDLPAEKGAGKRKSTSLGEK